MKKYACSTFVPTEFGHAILRTLVCRNCVATFCRGEVRVMEKICIIFHGNLKFSKLGYVSTTAPFLIRVGNLMT